MLKKIMILIVTTTFSMMGYVSNNIGNPEKQQNNEETLMNTNNKSAIATFGGGCFWCVEAIFQRVTGVISVISGYSGGTDTTPTYEEVCSGSTGHAEAVQIEFDTEIISYTELLEIFWKTHDPTTLNRQGADVGTQYRSIIFYHNEEQKDLAIKYKAKLDEAGIFLNPIVTEIVPFQAFYTAEDYHQNYYTQNKNQPYCSAVITPKLEKFERVFRDKLK
jgi:peptide-methionine (S)-S-oxide reductase